MRAALLLALIAAPAGAQVVSTPPAPVNLSGYATKAEVSAVQASIPVPGGVVPTETIGGTAGVVTNAFMRADAKPNRITRAASCTTNASGTCTVTYDALPASDPNVITTPINSGTMPITCNLTAAATATSASVKCWTAQSVTVSILGAVVAPVTTSAAGVTIQVTAVPKTQ